MTSDHIAYNVLQTTMARQRVTVYDLYGLLGVSPNVDEDGLRAAYDSIAQNLQQIPSDVVSTPGHPMLFPCHVLPYIDGR